ncbi:hypothetical protein [Corynebacterium frankenforstense]|uniref:hypothetical protein n=1 Tax=Corynebacterium frankenforstense TaxID=1230998 RepID=UPI0026F2D76D|nr:hypothetical protein [Corynebacterium frankenforstense]
MAADSKGTAAGARGTRPTVHLVNSRAELREFIALPGRLEGWSTYDVPVRADEITKWYRGRSVLPGVRLWLARDRTGAAVGRMVTHQSALLNGRLSRGPEALGEHVRAQLFGAFVAADQVVARALIRQVTRMAHGVGATHVFGPCTLLPNMGGGVLRSGFDRPAFLTGAWNPDWLPQVLEEEGYNAWHVTDTWRIDVSKIPAERAVRPTESDWRAKGLRLRRPGRFRVRAETLDLLWVLNDSYGHLPYFTKLSREYLGEKLAGLEPLLDPNLLVMADDAFDGRTVSFSLAMPDPSVLLRVSDGRIDHRSTARLVRAKLRGEARDAVLIAQATHPDAQLGGALNLVTRELYASLREGGYDQLHIGRISRDNPGAAAVLSKAGGHPEQETAFYIRELPNEHWDPESEDDEDDVLGFF